MSAEVAAINFRHGVYTIPVLIRELMKNAYIIASAVLPEIYGGKVGPHFASAPVIVTIAAGNRHIVGGIYCGYVVAVCQRVCWEEGRYGEGKEGKKREGQFSSPSWSLSMDGPGCGHISRMTFHFSNLHDPLLLELRYSYSECFYPERMSL
jgi:hypothetical protein